MLLLLFFFTYFFWFSFTWHFLSQTFKSPFCTIFSSWSPTLGVPRNSSFSSPFLPLQFDSFHSLSLFLCSLQSQVFVTPFVLHRKFIAGHILGTSKKPIWVTSWLWFKATLSYVIHKKTSLNEGEKTKIPKSLLPRHWDAGLYHPMSMLSPALVGHEVLGKGAWWTAG